MDIVFIETPEFIKKIKKIATLDEFHKLQDELLMDPLKGPFEKGTGEQEK